MSTWLRLTLITMSVGGGFTGVAVTSQALFSPQVKGPAVVAMCTVFVLLYAFVIVSGLLVAYDPKRTRPLAAALALQVPVISSPIVVFRFGAGLVLPVGLSENGFFCWVRFGADWQFNLLQRFPWGIGVNLVPLVLLITLGWSITRRARTDHMLVAGVPPATV